MSDKVMTAPLAVIKVNGQSVGLMKNIRVTENLRRGRVSGLGQLIPSEWPALEWSGSLNCSFYHIRLDKTGLPTALRRDVPSLEAWIDNTLLFENGVDVTIFKKVKDQINAQTGLIEAKFEEFATIQGCFVEREGFDISEGQISGKDQDFQYTTPILYYS